MSSRRRHIAMVVTDGRKTCACELHPCPSSPQLGDPLCRICRQHCYQELVRRDRNRKRKIVILVSIAIAGSSYVLGHFLGPVLFGG